DVRGRAVDRFEHRRRGAVHVDIARRRQANAAGDRRGQVGDDVAEQVVGDNHVEASGVGDHEDGGRVDVQVVDGDVRELRADGLHGAAPEVTGVDQHVVLVYQREPLAAGGGAAEGVADHALHAVGGIDRNLGGNFVRRAHPQRTAV